MKLVSFSSCSGWLMRWLAGLAHEIGAGRLNVKGRRIVAVCTGHGLKDPDIITKEMTRPLVVPPRLDALEEVILQ